ncbi:hypothetical protein QWY84_11140 [Aquisalimonas lutea]|uniref:hypothetical protein n=1 Tax=Aquisalimonas lutea TaxID=1327750 RepID=UPI0025B49467|nr:hypothetical protein [Aquisalimonas lutea]MDN3518166.1 hypothetical protein [Aquisalimonas lutea]
MTNQAVIDEDIREMTELMSEAVTARMQAAGIDISTVAHDSHGAAVADMFRAQFCLPEPEAAAAAQHTIDLIQMRALEQRHAARMAPGGTA